MKDYVQEALEEWDTVEDVEEEWDSEDVEVPEWAINEIKHKREFAIWLDEQEHLTDVRPRERNMDFTIGEQVIWPSYFEDDELNAIGSSSISMWASSVPNLEAFRYVNEVKIHLPPAHEDLESQIDEELNLPDKFGVHYGTGALGGMPAPDGVVTPHILSTDNVAYADVQQVVEQAIDVYVNVYEEGTKAIKRQPEEYRP